MNLNVVANASSDTGRFLESVETYIDRACHHLDLPEGLAERIRACNSTDNARFSVRLRGRICQLHG